MILSLILFGLGAACFSITQLWLHGKLKWGEEAYGFWGEHSDTRKYRKTKPEGWVIDAPDNFYYRLFNVKHKEAFPLSTTFLVSFTDGYHMTQSLMFIFFSISLSLATEINFFYVWIGILLVHFTVYRILQK